MARRSNVGAAYAVGLALGAGTLAFGQEPPAGIRSVTPSQTEKAIGGQPIMAGAGLSSEPTARGPAALLLDAIVTWLSANFDLPANYNHPKIEFAPIARIVALRFGMVGAGQSEVVAVYLDRMRTIVLPEAWTGRTPAQLSVLVHELVHHLQNLDKRVYFCPEAREKLAYEAQEKWLGLFGRSLLQDFQIDAMTLKVATACM